MAEDTAGLDLLLTNSRLEKPKANIHAMSPVPIGFLADGHPARLAEAVVPTVTVTELGELPVTLTDAGTLQTGAGDAAGLTLQVRVTVPLNDPAGVSAKLKVAACPAEIVELDPPEGTLKVKSGVATPVPVRVTTCGELNALSII